MDSGPEHLHRCLSQLLDALGCCNNHKYDIAVQVVGEGAPGISSHSSILVLLQKAVAVLIEKWTLANADRRPKPAGQLTHEQS